LLWTFGSLSYSAAVDNIGVTRSTPIKNLAPAFAAFYGIAFFSEYVITQPRALFMTVGGVALMVLAAYFIGRASAQEHERARAFDVNADPVQRKRAFKAGMLYSLSAAFFYGAYSVPLKWLFKHDVSVFTACAWLGIGVLASTVVAYAIKAKRLLPAWPGKREAALGATAGGIWTSGQIVGALAMLYIPMSISWPVSNLGTLVAIGWGVLIFKEVRIEKHKLEFAASLVVYVAGLVLLALAAPAGRV
jgi:glucose uptake protein GlcU